MPSAVLPPPVATSALVDLWVQGLRRESEPNGGWRPVLFARLASQHDSLPTGTNTAAAEDGLGLERNCYFYVGRCEPDMGDQAVVFLREHGPGNRVTPFDTGGLWHGHIVTDPPTDKKDLGDLVSRYSFKSDQYSKPMSDWVEQAFQSELGYASGVAPTRPFAKEIKIDGASGARHWTWEARIPLRLSSGLSLEPLAAVLDGAQYRHFTTWVRRATRYSLNTRREVLRLTRAIRIDPGGEAHGVFLNRLIGERLQTP
jgi:hypothetical protein